MLELLERAPTLDAKLALPWHHALLSHRNPLPRTLTCAPLPPLCRRSTWASLWATRPGPLASRRSGLLFGHCLCSGQPAGPLRCSKGLPISSCHPCWGLLLPRLRWGTATPRPSARACLLAALPPCLGRFVPIPPATTSWHPPPSTSSAQVGLHERAAREKISFKGSQGQVR